MNSHNHVRSVLIASADNIESDVVKMKAKFRCLQLLPSEAESKKRKSNFYFQCKRERESILWEKGN